MCFFFFRPVFSASLFSRHFIYFFNYSFTCSFAHLLICSYHLSISSLLLPSKWLVTGPPHPYPHQDDRVLHFQIHITGCCAEAESIIRSRGFLHLAVCSVQKIHPRKIDRQIVKSLRPAAYLDISVSDITVNLSAVLQRQLLCLSCI